MIPETKSYYKAVRVVFDTNPKKYISALVDGVHCLEFKIGDITKVPYESIRSNHGIALFETINQAKSFIHTTNVSRALYILEVQAYGILPKLGFWYPLGYLLACPSFGSLYRQTGYRERDWPTGTVMARAVKPIRAIHPSEYYNG